jgi:hypothetical protein
MDDDQLKEAVDEILSRKKGPIELAFEMYEVMGRRYHAAEAVGRPKWTPSQLRVMAEEYDLAKKTLAEELWKGAQAPETGLVEELKSLARAIMPRPKP